MMMRFRTAATLGTGLALAACGGGDDSVPAMPPPPPPPAVATAVPDSAIASVPALLSYLGGQNFADETSEALTLPAGDPPTTETDEPQPV